MADGPLAIGIDIGGTKIMAGVVDSGGTVVELRRRPTLGHDVVGVENTIVELVQELQQQYDVAAVGIGAAGFVDSTRSTLMFSPHLAWRDEPLREALMRRIKVPVVVDNDANTAALAECRFGAGVGHRYVLCITLGTGIGGAFVIDNRVFRGQNGMAGEFGHMQVVPDGHRCECGNRGCWEQYASGNALVRDARELLAEVGRWLGIGMADLAAALDPGMFVVGGGVSAAGDLLLQPARDAFRRQLTGRGYRPEAAIVAAQLGNEAGLVGAADLARTDAISG